MDASSRGVDFPLLDRQIEGKRITYLDSAATSLRPRAVLQAIGRYYEQWCANVHRGQHVLAQEAAERYEEARDRVAAFLGTTARQVSFTSGATASLNALAEGLLRRPEMNVVVSQAEHHSNLVPYQRRAQVRAARVDEQGRIDAQHLADLVDDRTALIAVAHASNVTGTIQDLRPISEIARRRQIPLVIDACQTAPHLPFSAEDLGCAALAFSAHKMLGPSGIGVLWLSPELVETLPPFLTGGGMVDEVFAESHTYKRAPHRFEAGTPNVEGALGFAAAIEYLERIGMHEVRAHDLRLSRHLLRRLAEVPELALIGSSDAEQRIGLVSLEPRGSKVDAEQLARVLSDTHNIMARAGTLCCHPFFASRGSAGALRLSTHIYSDEADIDRAIDAMIEILRG